MDNQKDNKLNMTENKKHPTWGGSRQGSGRKKLGKVSVFARLQEQAAQELRRRAEDQGVDIGSYLTNELKLL